MKNLCRFLLELGDGFSFIGEKCAVERRKNGLKL